MNYLDNKAKNEAVRSNNPNTYVEYWLLSRDYEYKKAGIWTNSGDQFRTDEMKKRLYVEYHTDFAEVKNTIKQGNLKLITSEKTVFPTYMKKDLLHDALDIRVFELIKAKLRAAQQMVAFKEEDAEYEGLRVFVSNLTTKDIDLGISVLRHFIWQVKRKMNGKKVIHHLSPIITGPQGKGKSQNIDRFLAPMEEYKISLQDATQVTDERRYISFGENFVATLDELSKMDKVDFNKIKNFITASELNPRILGTHIVMPIPQNVTITGSSNFALNEQIYDTSGMRRFYELKVDKEISQEVSESIDYLRIWRSVDENGPSPILPYLDQLSEHQESIRTKDTFEQFFEEFQIDPNKPLTYKVKVRDCMYEKFKSWATETGNGGPWMKDQVIKTKLINKGILQKTIRGQLYYLVNEDCLLNPEFATIYYRSIESEKDIDEIDEIPVLQNRLDNAVKAQDYDFAATLQKRINTLKHKHDGSLPDLFEHL